MKGSVDRISVRSRLIRLTEYRLSERVSTSIALKERELKQAKYETSRKMKSSLPGDQASRIPFEWAAREGTFPICYASSPY